MANDCYYRMRAVSKNEEALKRLLDIMKYNDPEYYIYRCFEAERVEDGQEDGLSTMDIEGFVAWGCSQWIHSEEKKDDILIKGRQKDENGNIIWDKYIYGTSHYAPLTTICKELGIGIEIWSQEPNMAFQAHSVVNSNGEIVVDECKDWEILAAEEDDTDENHEYADGFGGDFMKFKTAKEIY